VIALRFFALPDKLAAQLMVRLALIVLLVMSVGLAWSIYNMEQRAELEMRGKAELLSSQFLSIRAFIAESQENILPAEAEKDGFKHLDPDAAERAVREVFGETDARFKETWLPGSRHTLEPFEEELLKQLEARPGSKDAWRLDMEQGARVFRYLVPITMEESCMGCHRDPGDLPYKYNVGDVAGVVSLTIPMSTFQENVSSDVKTYLTVTLVLLFLVMLIIYILINRMVNRPLQQLTKMAADIGEGKLEHSWHEMDMPGEIKVLAASFQAMAEKIKGYYDDLERQVNLRTQQLLQANETLKQQRAELETVNQQLFKANKLKSEFLAGVSHDLRTPLTSIMAFTELLLDEIGGPLTPRQREYLQDISSSSSRLLKSINQILEIARAEARKVELNLTTFRPADLIQGVYRQMHPLAAKKNIDLKVEVPANLPPVEGDLEKVENILINLVDNAIKFTPEDGEVRIKAEAGNRQVIFSVVDNGRGIPESDLGDIFEPFRQVNYGPEKENKGTGLGLALAKSLVLMHGGEIGAESRINQGSVFWFILPLVQQLQERREEA